MIPIAKERSAVSYDGSDMMEPTKRVSKLALCGFLLALMPTLLIVGIFCDALSWLPVNRITGALLGYSPVAQKVQDCQDAIDANLYAKTSEPAPMQDETCSQPR